MVSIFFKHLISPLYCLLKKYDNQEFLWYSSSGAYVNRKSLYHVKGIIRLN